MEPPIKPDEADCCNSCCNPCILDVYEEQLRKCNNRQQSDTNIEGTYTNCLSPTSYSVFKVIEIEEHCEDALLITFEYIRPSKICSNSNNPLRILSHAGQHILLKQGQKNDEFTRAYTPIPLSDNDNFRFTILVKLYEGGRMSTYINHWRVSRETEWRGPYGNFVIDYNYKHILFIAQGAGIAPIYSVICNLIANEDCSTFLKLYYCCKSSKQIYLRDKLYDLQSNWNFNYELFLSNSENLIDKYNETLHRNKLESSAIRDYLDSRTSNVQIIICGSEIFGKSLKQVVMELGIAEKNIYLF